MRHRLLRMRWDETLTRYYQGGCIAIRMTVDPDGCWHWKVWPDGVLFVRSTFPIPLEAALGHSWELDDAKSDAAEAFVAMAGIPALLDNET